MASTKFTHNDYTVGWVCALPKEQTAALAMLDCEHPTLPKQPSDRNAYTLGEVKGHNVVIACLPKGIYGTTPAATVATNMLHSFPSIKFGLMVGIGAGIPPQVRLGDVVVSSPIKQYPGVVQWDFGESVKGGHFKKIGVLNNPPTELLTALSNLESKRTMTGYKIPQYLIELASKYPKLVPKYIKSDSLKDPLDSPTGVQDDRVGLIALLLAMWGMVVDLFNLLSGWQTFASSGLRHGMPPSQQREMQVHYGLIASGNRLIKDSVLRDNINREMDGHVLCIEMEAAGLANEFPCLVIRGICDYADSGKNKDWQEHAAAVAAAFAKDLLSELQATEVIQMRDAKLLLEMKAGLDDVSQKVTHLHSACRNQKHHDILEWLTPIDYASVHNDTIKRRQPGTCQWLLDSEQYQTWLKTRKETLFCPGIPGAGKTILASVVVNDLVERFRKNSNVGIVYIYCNYRRQDDQKIDKILANLLKQLAEHQSSIPNVIKALYDHHEPRKTFPLIDELSVALMSLMKIYDQVYVIVDALDECQTSGGTRSQLLQQLADLKEHSDVNLFITSRYMPDVEENLRGNITKLDIRASEEDVGRYLDNRLASVSELVTKNKELRDHIRTKVVKAVDGMFLLAELHIRSLEGMFLPRQIRHALETLPTGTTAYDETYKGAMNRIESRADTKGFAKKVLAWITCARRPLKTLELQHALSVQVGDTDLDKKNLPEIGDVIAVCAGLVIVDQESNIIRLAHYTTQQYFERTQGEWFPNAETEITIACVTYLSYKAFQRKDRRLRNQSLYYYVAANWGHHGRISQTTNIELMELLKSNQFAMAATEALINKESSRNIPPRYNPYHSKLGRMNIDQYTMTGVHLAAYFGMTEAVSALLDHGEDPNATDALARTPLTWAAMKNHSTTVRSLLNKGANPYCRDANGKSLLSTAAENGHEYVISMLLETEGIDANSRDNSGKTPLSLAAENGHVSVVKMFLATEGVDVDSRDNNGRTPLSLAAENRHESVVRILLATEGVNANSWDDNGASPLHYAAGRNHTAICDIMLSTGKVDIDAKDKNHETPVFKAAQRGHHKIVGKLLGISRTDANCRNKVGETLLFQAAKCGHEEVVKLLLTVNEIQVDLRDTRGRTPLFTAAKCGYAGIVKMLIDYGKADVNARCSYNDDGTDDCLTPLRIAYRENRREVVIALLELHQVQIEEEGRSLIKILSHAVSNDDDELVGLILNTKTADANLFNERGYYTHKKGYTPLTWAAFMGHKSIVRLLLEVQHVDVDAKDDDGKTPLERAASKWRKPVVWLLLEHGAKFDETIRASMKPLSESSKEEIRIVMFAAMWPK